MPTHDPDAFWSLVHPHDRALRALAYRLVGDRDLMDDVLQEAYLRAFRALPSLRAADALGSWLYRIVYNASMDLVRGRQRTAHLALEEAPEPPDLAPTPPMSRRVGGIWSQRWRPFRRRCAQRSSWSTRKD
jgi:RNA polymerase sigma-70 factor, ECF subfamily